MSMARLGVGVLLIFPCGTSRNPSAGTHDFPAGWPEDRHHPTRDQVSEGVVMTGWQIAAACACAAPGVVLGLLLVVRRQYVVGVLLVALGVLPLILLSPDPASPRPGAAALHGADLAIAVFSVSAWVWFYLPPALLAAYFPDGRLPSRRWRWLIGGWVAFVAGFNLAVAVDPGSYGTGAGQIPGRPPVDVPGWLASAIGFAALALLLALLVGSVWCVATRYRQGSELVRRQLKWFALSVLLLPLVLVATWIAYLLTDVAGLVVVVGLLLVFVSIPVTVAIAVLRHDLYDVNRLFSQTVTYVLVTGLLAALFGTTTVVVGVLVGRGSPLAIALATLASALAFAPARARLQRLVDGRFDRDRSEALARVARFVDSVREGTVEPEAIEDTLRGALRDPRLRVLYAMTSDTDEPWRDSRGRPATRPSEHSLDLAVRGRLLASVWVADADRRPQLLRDVLREAHLPLELARSRIELSRALAETEASRARLLVAGDEERRRLERDLHDGAQQRLVAIGMSLRLAQQRVTPTDPAYDALGRAVVDLQDAIRELRRLAGGVRPRGLDEGLLAAIRELVRGCPVSVELRVTAEQLPVALATTAYYVTAEAVTNALKHAQPRAVCIEVGKVDGALVVLIEDDGCGGAAVTPGSGLAGLRDRVLATGGELVIDSRDGRGTRVEARLPCE